MELQKVMVNLVSMYEYYRRDFWIWVAHVHVFVISVANDGSQQVFWWLPLL